MAKSDPLQRAPERSKPTKEAEKAAEEAPSAEDAPPLATSVTAVADAAGTAPTETETRIDEAEAEASADLPDGFGSGEPDPSRDGHDTIVDGEPPTSSPSDAVTEYRDRDEIPTDAAGLEEYARNEIADAIAGPGDSLLAGTGFGSGALDRSPLDGTHGDQGPIGIAEQGIGGISDGGDLPFVPLEPLDPTLKDLRPDLNNTADLMDLVEDAPFIDQSSYEEDQSLTPAAAAARDEQVADTLWRTSPTRLAWAERRIAKDERAREKEAERIEGEVKADAEMEEARKAEAEFKEKEGIKTPDQEEFDPDSVGGQIARALRASTAPRGGGGDGHTDPADDVEAIVRSGAVPDSQDTLLGGDTRGDTEGGGSNHGVPDQNAGTIDPLEENDFGSGSGRSIDPLAGGSSLRRDFGDADNAVDDQSSGEVEFHEPEVYSGPVEYAYDYDVVVEAGDGESQDD